MSTAPLPRPPASRPPMLRLLVGPPEASPLQPALPLDPPVAVVAPPDDTTIAPALLRVLKGVAIALAEVLVGRRPPAQAAAVLHPDLGHQWGHLLRSRAVLGYRVASLRVQMPHDEAAEVTVRLSDGTRSRAVALRLEGRGGRWRCTALEAGLVGGPSSPSRGSA